MARLKPGVAPTASLTGIGATPHPLRTGNRPAMTSARVPRSQVSMSQENGQPAGPLWHGTTILCLRKGGRVVIAGDGQVSMGNTIVKSNAKKLRRLGGGTVIAGFAGATADAFALFERLEAKLEQHPAQLPRACVELAKDWRTDRYLRRPGAMKAVAGRPRSALPPRPRARPQARDRAIL